MGLFGSKKEGNVGTLPAADEAKGHLKGDISPAVKPTHTEQKIAIAPNRVPEEKRANVKNELARAGSDFVIKLVEEYLKVNPLSPEDLGDEGHIRLLVEASFDTVKNWFVDKVDPSLTEHQFLFEIGLIKQTKEEMYQLAMATVHASRAMKMISHDAESADVSDMLQQFDDITRNSTISDLTKCKISREVLLKPTIDSVREGNYTAAEKQFEFIQRLNDQLSPYEPIPDPEAACAKVAEQTVYSIIAAQNEQLSHDQLFELNQRYQTVIAKAKQARNGCRRAQQYFEQRERELIIAGQGNIPESEKRKAELADHYIGRSEAWLIGAKILNQITADKQVDSGNVNRLLEQVLGDIDIQLAAVTPRVFTVEYPFLSKADLQYAEYLVDDLTFELPEFDMACIAHNVHRADTLASSHDTEAIDMQRLMSMQDGPERDALIDTLEFKPVIATDTKSKLGKRTVLAAGVAASITIGVAAPAAAQEGAGNIEQASMVLEYNPSENPGQAISEGDGTVSVKLSQSSVESNNKKIKTPNIPSPKGEVYKSGLGKGPFVLEDFVEHTLIRLSQLYDKPESDFLTEEHKTAMIAFALGEGGDIMNKSRFNPWNLGYKDDDVAPIPYAAGGVDGRQSYPSFDQGVEAYARQLSKGTQRRIGYVLSQPDSTAKDFMYAITHYELYEGNNFWAEASLEKNGGPNDRYRLGPKEYYETRLDLVSTVKNNYEKYASLRIGTYEYEQKEGMRKPGLLDRSPEESPAIQDDTEQQPPAQDTPSEPTAPDTDSSDVEPKKDKADRGQGKDNPDDGKGIVIGIVDEESPATQDDTEQKSPAQDTPSEPTAPATDSTDVEPKKDKADKDKGKDGADDGNGIAIAVIDDETLESQIDAEQSPAQDTPSEPTAPDADSNDVEPKKDKADHEPAKGSRGNGSSIGIAIVADVQETIPNLAPSPSIENADQEQSPSIIISVEDDDTTAEASASQTPTTEVETNIIDASNIAAEDVVTQKGNLTFEIIQDEPNTGSSPSSNIQRATESDTDEYQLSGDQQFTISPALFTPSSSSDEPVKVTTFRTFDTGEPVVDVKGTSGTSIESKPAPAAAEQIAKTAISFIAAGDKFQEQYGLIREIPYQPMAEKLDVLRSQVDSNLAKVADDPNFEQIKDESYTRLAAAYDIAAHPDKYSRDFVKDKVVTPEHLVRAKIPYMRAYNTAAVQSSTEILSIEDPNSYNKEITKGILMIAHSAIAAANTPATLKADSGKTTPAQQNDAVQENPAEQQNNSPEQESKKESKDTKEKQTKPETKKKEIDYDHPWPEKTLGTPLDGYKKLPGIHTGQDYEVPKGTPTKSPADGVVVELRRTDDDAAGLYIKILHPDNRVSTLEHLSKIYVKVGQHVKKGELIALSGDSGRGTGAHGHWSLSKPGEHDFPNSSDPNVLKKVENPAKFAD